MIQTVNTKTHYLIQNNFFAKTKFIKKHLNCRKFYGSGYLIFILCI